MSKNRFGNLKKNHRLTALLLAFGCLSFLTTVSWGETVGIATIVEGNARVLRGVNFYALKEGVQISSADILETGDRAFVQVEYSDGSMFSVGPTTSAVIGTFPAGAARQGDIFLITGWLKASGSPSAGLLWGRASTIALQPKAGVYVLRKQGPITQFFVEAGQLLAIGFGKSGAKNFLCKTGDFVAVKSDLTLDISGRPNAAFLAELPRPFLDSPAIRFAKFKGQKVEPIRERPLHFDEAAHLIDSLPLQRKPLLNRFAERLKDKDFRSGVEERLSSYPEWGLILHPEKYLPKERKP